LKTAALDAKISKLGEIEDARRQFQGQFGRYAESTVGKDQAQSPLRLGSHHW